MNLHDIMIASPPGGVRGIAMGVSLCLYVCLSVRSHI